MPKGGLSMNKSQKLLPYLALIAFSLAGCGSNNGSSTEDSSGEGCIPPRIYTITWKNYDGTVLETDTDVIQGSLPTYDGATPTKPSDTEYKYTWSGWDPKVVEASKDQVYTATFTSEKISVPEETYTITWKNYDGTVLETDTNVKKGNTPTYDGATPTRPDDTEYKYTWSGWDPKVAEVSKDQVYTATYTSEKLISDEERYATKPIVSSDGKTIKYGLYPQTNVNDVALVSTLNALTSPESNGWYLHEGNYYAKVEAKPYKTTYTFDNGAPITKGETYWFRCEPIVWKVLSNKSGEYFILSNLLLDAHCFYNSSSDRTSDGKTIYANNYKYSDIRTWLNDEFYNSAFALGNSHIQLTAVDNSVGTTGGDNPKYVCDDTNDKVFLPSHKDYRTRSYGFATDVNVALSRYCKTTDWARARGSLSSSAGEDYPNQGAYLTRSPNNESLVAVWGANIKGELCVLRAYDKDSGVRPSISIKIS